MPGRDSVHCDTPVDGGIGAADQLHRQSSATATPNQTRPGPMPLANGRSHVPGGRQPSKEPYLVQVASMSRSLSRASPPCAARRNRRAGDGGMRGI